MRVFRLRVIACILLYCTLLSPGLSSASIPERIQEALKLMESGDTAGARKILEEVIEEDSNHGPARLLLGQLTLETCDLSAAQEHLRIAVNSNPRRIHLAWYLLGKVYLLQHRYQEARESFSTSLSNEPSFGPARMGRAKASLFLKDLEAARRDALAASALEGTAWEAKLLTAGISLIENRKEDVTRILSGMLSDSALPPRMLISTEMMLGAAKDAGAINFQRYISRHMEFADVYLAAGIQAMRIGRMEEGRRFLEISSHVDDQNPVSAYFLTAMGVHPWTPAQPLCRVAAAIDEVKDQMEVQSYDRKISNLEVILQDRRSHLPVRFLKLDILEKEGNLWEALHYAKGIQEQFPELAIAHARIAAIAMRMRAPKVALCSSRRALELEGENGAWNYLHATIRKELGETDQAIDLCRAAVELGYNEAAVYVTLGNLYYERMEISESISALAVAVEKEPKEVENIASFALSALSVDEFQLLKSVLEKHLENHPGNVTTLYALGSMYLREERLEQAEACFTRLIEIAPEHSQVVYNMGLILFRQGKDREGEKWMARFRELKEKELQEWSRQNAAHRLRVKAAEAEEQGDSGAMVRIWLELAAMDMLNREDVVRLAKGYVGLKDYSSALVWFERALQVFPYDTDVLKGMADMARFVGNEEVALEFKERVELLTPHCEDGR